MSEIQFSNRILRRFAETVALELGPDQFSAMLALANLPAEWKNPQAFLAMNPYDSAHIYAALQTALRIYFGRGARGVLLRVGQRLWERILDDAALGIKAQAACEALALLGIFRNGMRLPFRFYLQAMFNAPQKTIRFIESAHF